eukprot:8160301-Lingulodinium_polyedra.AAC.1
MEAETTVPEETPAFAGIWAESEEVAAPPEAAATAAADEPTGAGVAVAASAAGPQLPPGDLYGRFKEALADSVRMSVTGLRDAPPPSPE